MLKMWPPCRSHKHLQFKPLFFFPFSGGTTRAPRNATVNSARVHPANPVERWWRRRSRRISCGRRWWQCWRAPSHRSGHNAARVPHGECSRGSGGYHLGHYAQQQQHEQLAVLPPGCGFKSKLITSPRLRFGSEFCELTFCVFILMGKGGERRRE